MGWASIIWLGPFYYEDIKWNQHQPRAKSKTTMEPRLMFAWAYANGDHHLTLRDVHGQRRVGPMHTQVQPNFRAGRERTVGAG